MSQGPSHGSGARPTVRGEIEAATGGAYAVEREVAAGGSARLFLATDTGLGRRVVLKVMPPELRATSATIDAARFRREIALAARLTHPNVVPLLSAGTAGGFLIYTMPFGAGESRHARLARAGDRLRVTAQLTSAGDGLALWSATYERSTQDVLAVQDEITGDIVRALAPRGRPPRPSADRPRRPLQRRGA